MDLQPTDTVDKIKAILETVRDLFPDHHSSIGVSADYYDHTKSIEVSYKLYIAKEINHKSFDNLSDLSKYVRFLWIEKSDVA